MSSWMKYLHIILMVIVISTTDLNKEHKTIVAVFHENASMVLVYGRMEFQSKHK